LATTEQYGVNLMNKVGASSIAEMRAKSWQEIILASVAPGSGYTTSQTVDGWFLLDTVAKTFQAGRQNDVPFIIGMNEGDLASVFNTAVSVVPTITPPLHSKFYAYLFTHVPSNWKAEGQKAYHTLELNYIFGDLPSITLRFGGPYVLPTLTNPDPGLGELDDWLQDAMATIWTQFAATGTPSVKGLVRWPAYDYRTDQYLKIDVPLEVKTGFSTLQCYSPGGRNCE
jgi:para-nitrobenzyl esterase